VRRSRRNGHAGLEFGGSGEDSFVAVVVTKLTGALLFILLLTMVIMALLPKTIDLTNSEPGAASADAPLPLAINTPEVLPEAIAGRPYAVALAATGGRGAHQWSVDGKLPDGLVFDGDSGRLHGTPSAGTPEPVELVLRVSDGKDRASRSSKLVVYQSDQPLSTPSKWRPALPPIPWRDWLEQGVGFLILLLIHSVGMNTLGGLQRWSLASIAESADSDEERRLVGRRFAIYRTLVRLASLSAAAALAVWLVQRER
jgi:hypothetical protein